MGELPTLDDCIKEENEMVQIAQGKEEYYPKMASSGSGLTRKPTYTVLINKGFGGTTTEVRIFSGTIFSTCKSL